MRSRWNCQKYQPLDPDEVLTLTNILLHGTYIEKEVIAFNIFNCNSNSVKEGEYTLGWKYLEGLFLHHPELETKKGDKYTVDRNDWFICTK